MGLSGLVLTAISGAIGAIIYYPIKYQGMGPRFSTIGLTRRRKSIPVIALTTSSLCDIAIIATSRTPSMSMSSKRVTPHFGKGY